MMKLVVANIPATVCYGIAGALALLSLSGWGWFLFVGLLCTHTLKTKQENE